MWTRLRLWLISLLRRRRFDADLADELAFHLRAREEHWEARGLSRAEARRRARIEFGSVVKTQAQVSDVRRGAWTERLLLDVRDGWRALRRYPGFSAMAVLSLAIGIGANTAIFSVVDAVLFRDSPLADPSTLVNLYETEGGRGFNPMSHPNVEDLRAGTRNIFTGIVASTFVAAPIDQGDMVMGEAVTGGAFALLGVEPQLGRAIGPDDDVARGGHPVVMLSHGFWQRAYGGDPEVIGRTLRIGPRGYTIIGVAPAEYRGGLPAVEPAFFVPMTMVDELMGIDMLDQRGYHNFFIRARLAPGVTRADAEHAASRVAESLTRARPEGWVPGEQFVLVPAAEVRIYPGLDPLLRAAAWLLMAIVGLVLLLACTNLASFLLARALDRGQESAVRRALGATRGALARQVFVESALLGFGGAAAGLLLAIVLVRALLSADLPLPYGFRLDMLLGLDWRALLDWNALAFAAGTGVVTGAALGVVPAIQGTRTDPGGALRTGGRGGDAPASRRWRNALLVAQVAISLVLLVGAGMFLRSWQATTSVDPGFGRAPAAILSIMVAATQSTPDEAVRISGRLLDRFRTVPGVEAAGLVWPLPLDFPSSVTDFTIDGRALPPGREAFRADRAFVDGGFFDAAGIPIVEGRTFADADRHDSRPVAIISHAMARRYWPDRSALEQVLRRPDPAEDDVVIVGVAGDINIRSLGEAARDIVYVPYTQNQAVMFSFVARTAIDAEAVVPALLAAGREIDPDLPVTHSTTMAQHLAMSRLPSRIGALLLVAFAVIAMALASIGVYGMVRHMATVRTREVGIRLALGADAARMARLLAVQGLRLALVGAAIGLAASLVVSRLLAALLFGVETLEPAALIGAPLVLVVAAWLAAWLPARRASRVDPLAALRTD